MKIGASAPAFQDRALGLAAAAMTLFVVSACASATIEDAVPQAALADSATPGAGGITNTAVNDTDLSTPQADPAADQGTAAYTSGPRDTGQYPNLNVPQRAAAEQISGVRKHEMIRELAAAKASQKQATGTATAGEAARLRQLAASHGESALEEIEQAE